MSFRTRSTVRIISSAAAKRNTKPNAVRRVAWAESELHGRFAFSAACLTFVLVAFPLTILLERQGRLVHYERLLLPFSQDGASVDRILASFEFVSPDGGFENWDLMGKLTAPPALRLSATIEPRPRI